ncbi:MAG: radical SAM protein [Burkholderiales bacterium]|nr:radical SAM protein [Burkholderiales bacterium]
MAKPYRIALNVEWTSKCNALCPMCPREAIERPQLMTLQTWDRVLARIAPKDVFRVVIAGYGEPTTHPRFFDLVDALRGHPVRFDMVSNGHLLDPDKLRHLDGAIDLLLVSFSSIDPEVYRRVHRNLDQGRVMRNLQAARSLLRHTQLGISLTPMPDCLASLPRTVAWLRGLGIDLLTMSPTLYNRAGSLTGHELATAQLRRLIARHRLRSQEFEFIPGVGDFVRQWRANRCKCVARNVDLFIAASGEYLYCYNDVGHRHPIGDVRHASVRETLTEREAMAPLPALCAGCDMRDRYGPRELMRTGIAYLLA